MNSLEFIRCKLQGVGTENDEFNATIATYRWALDRYSLPSLELFVSLDGAEWSDEFKDPPKQVLDCLREDGRRYRPVSMTVSEGWSFPADPETGKLASIVSAKFKKWCGPVRCVTNYEYYTGLMDVRVGSIELTMSDGKWHYLRDRFFAYRV